MLKVYYSLNITELYLWFGVLECRLLRKADSYAYEKRIRKWTKSGGGFQDQKHERRPSYAYGFGLLFFRQTRTGLPMRVRCVCVFFPSILDIKFVGRTSRGHTRGRSHRIFNPPSFCGACLDFCREKDSAIPFPRRP